MDKLYKKLGIMDGGNNIGDLVYIVSSKGIITSVNKMSKKIIGLEANDMIGKSIDELWEMGAFSSDYNFFLGYNETKPDQLIDSLYLRSIDEILVTNKDAPRLSLYAIEKKAQVSGVTRLPKTGKIVLIVCTPTLNKSDEVAFVNTIIRDLTPIINLKSKIHIVQQRLDEALKEQVGKSTFVAVSKEIKKVKYIIEELAGCDATVLITGDTGTGKEVIAKEIHRNSRRSKKPYICINCAAIPETLFESELFGYEKGAFTGALNKTKIGIFERANGGTILLDEVEALQMPMQAKLLRTLQEKSIRRVGGIEEIKVDVRIISASNRNLVEIIHNGEFREDLYYRLNVISIKVPPLKERHEDILPLAENFLREFNIKYEKNKRFSNAAVGALESYSWPGNVRDLEHTIERLVIIGREDCITERDVVMAIDQDFRYLPNKTETLESAVNRTEKNLIEDAIKLHGSSRKVAEALGVSQPTILRRCKKLGINIKET